MGFDPGFIDEVKGRTSLVRLIGREVKLSRRGQDHWGCCPFHAEKTPSFAVNEAKGFAHCFGCGWHGDAVAYLMGRTGLSFVEAVEELAIEAGLQADREGRTKPKARRIERPEAADFEAEKAGKIAWAKEVWASAGPAAGSPVETYLAARGIDLARLPSGIPPTLRFHPGLHHADSGRTLPAMVAAVQDGRRRVSGIHRTFLDPSGRSKAAVSSAKKMAGVMWGGAIRLCPAEPVLGIAEGIETALSVLTASGLPTWAAGSLGNMAAVELPPLVTEVVLCADSDGDAAALEKNIAKATAFHAGRGRRVRIARPPAGMDFNDMLRGD